MIVFMSCASSHDLMTDTDITAYLDKVRAYVNEIAISIIIPALPRPIDEHLTKCRDEMDTYITHFHGNMDKTFFRNKLIFALRDEIRARVYRSNVLPNAQFDVAEKKFRELFNYDLALLRGRLPDLVEYRHHEEAGGPYNRYYENDHYHGDGPIPDNASDPTLPPGAGGSGLHYEFTILENLHRRLSALEQRNGAF